MTAQHGWPSASGDRKLTVLTSSHSSGLARGAALSHLRGPQRRKGSHGPAGNLRPPPLLKGVAKAHLRQLRFRQFQAARPLPKGRAALQLLARTSPRARATRTQALGLRSHQGGATPLQRSSSCSTWGGLTGYTPPFPSSGTDHASRSVWRHPDAVRSLGDAGPPATSQAESFIPKSRGESSGRTRQGHGLPQGHLTNRSGAPTKTLPPRQPVPTGSLKRQRHLSPGSNHR